MLKTNAHLLDTLKTNAHHIHTRTHIAAYPKFIHSGHFYSASNTTQSRFRLNTDIVSEFHAEAPHATASEGLVQCSHEAARAGFEPTTLRYSKGRKATILPMGHHVPHTLTHTLEKAFKGRISRNLFSNSATHICLGLVQSIQQRKHTYTHLSTHLLTHTHIYEYIQIQVAFYTRFREPASGGHSCFLSTVYPLSNFLSFNFKNVK